MRVIVAFLKAVVICAVLYLGLAFASIYFFISTLPVRRASYDFLWHCHFHDWSNANALLSQKMNSSFGPQLRQEWATVEQTRGEIVKWSDKGVRFGFDPLPVATISYSLQGKKPGTAYANFTLRRESGGWRIKQLKFQP